MGRLNPERSVNFHFEKTRVSLGNRNRLKTFINEVVTREKKTLDSLNYIFCTDKDLLEINRQYLNHDFYTDVIAFDLSSSSKQILADIYISVDRVRQNAKTVNSSVRDELHRVMFHGLLHLCGYNDKAVRQRKTMRAKENFYLDLYHTFHVKQ